MPAPPPVPDLAHALALHRAGDFAAARAAYRRRVMANPRDIPATHGLGLIALDLGRAAEAMPYFARCIALDTDNPLYRTSYGMALMAQGDIAGAAGFFLDAANRPPVLAEPRLNLARALMKLSRWQEALNIFRDTTTLFPDRVDAWIARGNAERQRGLKTEAEASLRRALALDPDDADTMNALGGLLKDCERIGEALEYYRAAVKQAPTRAVFFANFGQALAAAGDVAAAEAALGEAIRLDHAGIDGPLGLGLLLTALERPSEAIPLFHRALAIAPDNADALTNLGVALLATGDTHGAEDCYRRALALTPKNAEAHYNLAWVLLLTGRWNEAWPHYAWRWQLKYFSSRKRGFRDVVWDGTPFEGTLLVHAEQGLGDAIQFARFLALARKRCGRLAFECHRPLARLFRALDGADEILPAGDPIQPFDRHIPLMSLPAVLGISPETIPSTDGYLHAPAGRQEHLRVPSHAGPRVGLVWAGSPDNKIDRRRSIPAEMLMPLMAAPRAGFVSLQVGERAADIRDLPRDRILFDCAGRVGDFADTAAVIAQLDLVIGVDTAAVHLAGALGKPAWLLLPYMPDFRWLLGRDDTPWYRSMRLFRQQKPADWPAVIERVAGLLTNWKDKAV